MLDPEEYGRQTAMRAIEERYGRQTKAARMGYQLLNRYIDALVFQISLIGMTVTLMLTLLQTIAPGHLVRWLVFTLPGMLMGLTVSRLMTAVRRRMLYEREAGLEDDRFGPYYARWLNRRDRQLR